MVGLLRMEIARQMAAVSRTREPRMTARRMAKRWRLVSGLREVFDMSVLSHEMPEFCSRP